MSDLGDICERCEDRDCEVCGLGNPCLGCEDYDANLKTCTSHGACGERRK